MHKVDLVQGAIDHVSAKFRESTLGQIASPVVIIEPLVIRRSQNLLK